MRRTMYQRLPPSLSSMVCWTCTSKTVALVYTELTYSDDSRGRPVTRRGEGVASVIDRGSGEVSAAKRCTFVAWPSPVLGEASLVGAQFSSRRSGSVFNDASRTRSNCLCRCIDCPRARRRRAAQSNGARRQSPTLATLPCDVRSNANTWRERYRARSVGLECMFGVCWEPGA